MTALKAKNLTVSYGEKIALKEASIEIEYGKIVTIIGPNGSGKSTLLKSLSGFLKPNKGAVHLNGVDIRELKKKEIAQNMAILPQIKHVSSDITVENLVSYGRYPHLKLGKQLLKEDKEIVSWAIKETGLSDYRNRLINSLSGGEDQRAWIAMALAQKPKILLLDEPTTYLDISYQLEVLELVRELNKSLELTVVMVLHDLNQAARYSDYLYVLNQGEVCNHGKPDTVMNPSLLKDIFRIEAHIYEDTINDCTYFIPSKII